MRALMIWILTLNLGLASCNNSQGTEVVEAQSIPQDDKKKDGDKKKDKKDKKDKGNGKEKSKNEASADLQIMQTWEMPGVLTEISGNVWYGKDKMAAVQDETGTIFIYDLASSKVEKEIPFAGKGDYEGVAMAGNTFYVLRSDGTVVEVKSDGKAKEYDTPLDVKNDTEGFFYDEKNNRLLIALKGPDNASQNARTVYAFDLGSKKLSAKPVFTIQQDNQVFAGKGKKKDEGFQPSDIAIHPVTGDIYLTDGANPAVLVLTSSGEPRSYIALDKSQFPQPEGITFSPAGDLYISTEGVKNTGKIMKVSLNNNAQEEESI